jgi:hypothetical protein
VCFLFRFFPQDHSENSSKRGRVVQRPSSSMSIPSQTEEGHYPCKTCGKVCTSAQQLGGHQNSHRTLSEKNKNSHARDPAQASDATESSNENEEVEEDEIGSDGHEYIHSPTNMSNTHNGLVLRTAAERARGAFHSPPLLSSPLPSPSLRQGSGSKPSTSRGTAAGMLKQLKSNKSALNANKMAIIASRARPTNNQLL